MQYRRLGQRGPMVSSIGYGCMGLSHGYGKVPEREESVRLIARAFELGCTFFDTAEVYGAGHNEVLVGEAVASFRDKIVLATKFFYHSSEGTPSRAFVGIWRLLCSDLEPTMWICTINTAWKRMKRLKKLPRSWAN